MEYHIIYLEKSFHKLIFGKWTSQCQAELDSLNSNPLIAGEFTVEHYYYSGSFYELVKFLKQ